jgi:hypothetical protein
MRCPKCQFENPSGAKLCGECAQKLGNDYYISFYKSLVGKTLSKITSSRFNQYEEKISASIKIAKKIESKPALAMGHLCLVEIYADNDQKEKALENLKKAEAMYQEMKMGLWLGETKELLDQLCDSLY